MQLALIFFILLFIGLPVAFVLLMSSVAYVILTDNYLLFYSFSQQIFSSLEKYGLLAIPLFLLVGELMGSGGSTRRLVDAASVFVGTLRGGLAYINLLANMMMASIMGSANAQIAIMSKAMVPEMVKKGYDPALAAATTAAGGLMSPIIPPSMIFIIYGVLAQVAIGDMFIAGIIPGLLMAIGFVGAVSVLGIFYEFPRLEKKDKQEKIKCVVDALPSLSIPVIIVCSILFGIATPTESAAVAAVTALVIGKWFNRELEPGDLWKAFLSAGTNTAVVLFLIALASLFGWVLIFEQIPQLVSAWIVDLTSDPFYFMLLVNVLLLFVGAVIDGIPAMIMIVPILLPIAQKVYDIDPYHFGVVISINLVLGLLTPPVGTGLYIASQVANVRPGRVFLAIIPFFLVVLLLLILLSWQPQLVTYFLN
jgi:tripartite ATP-independent transporter DctM subunit